MVVWLLTYLSLILMYLNVLAFGDAELLKLGVALFSIGFPIKRHQKLGWSLLLPPFFGQYIYTFHIFSPPSCHKHHKHHKPSTLKEKIRGFMTPPVAPHAPRRNGCDGPMSPIAWEILGVWGNRPSCVEIGEAQNLGMVDFPNLNTAWAIASDSQDLPTKNI